MGATTMHRRWPFGGLPTPEFSPASGAYSSTQKVVLTDSMPGVTIYYSTDGSHPYPGPGFKVYSGPITVSSPETLTAIVSNAYYDKL